MNRIQLFKVLVILNLFCLLFSVEIKPDNNKDIVKIKVGDNNRTYYHLKKNDKIVYSFKDKGLENLLKKHSIKIISRTLIASNSNSNKIFGLELSIYNNNDLVEKRQLKYNKKTSNAISESKPGWNFTKAGFWFEELEDLEDVFIELTLLEGSPDIEVKLLVEKISLRSSKAELNPITMQDEFIVRYKDTMDDSINKNSDNWYLLNEFNPLQFKIKGPQIIRFISRYQLKGEESTNYSFILRENGKYISQYNYEGKLSSSEAYIKESNIAVSGYNSSFFNIPKGIHYYTFSVSDNKQERDIFLKLEHYENNQ